MDLDATKHRANVLIVVLIYAGLASLWILLSEESLGKLLYDPTSISFVDNIESWVFVVLTSTVLYGLLRRYSREGKAFKTTKLREKASRWPLFLLSLTAIGLSAITTLHAIDNQKKEEAARLLAVAHLKSQIITDWLNERDADATVIQKTSLFNELYQRWHLDNDTEARSDLLALLSQYQDSYGYSDIMLFDAPSTLVWSINGAQTDTDNRKILHNAITTAVENAQVHRTRPYRNADGRAQIDWVIPLSTSGTNSRPVMVLRVDPNDHLYALLKKWPTLSGKSNQSSELLLFRRDGDEIHFLNDLKYQSETATIRRAPVETTRLLAAQGVRDEHKRGRLIEGVDYRNVGVFGMVLPVADTDWFLVAKIDLRELYGQIGDRIRWIILIALLILAATWATMRFAQQRHVLAKALKDRERDELIHHVSTMARIGGWEFDPATGSGSWTEETARIHEVPANQKHSADSVLDFFKGESRQQLESAIKKVIDGGDHCDLELEMLTAQGNNKWVRVIGWPIQQSGQTTKLQGAIQDISRQKHTKLMLERERGLLKTLIRTLPDLIWLKNREGVYIACNHRFEQFFGASEAEIIGKTDYDFVDKELADFFRANDLKAAALNKPSVNQETLPFPDGHAELAETTKMPMHDPHGKLIGILGIARDITAQHEAQEALRESEAHTRLLLESTAEAIYGVDTEGTFTFVNPACLRLLGYERDDELLGQHSHTLMHHSRPDGSPYPARECRVYEALQSNQGVYVDDEVFWRRDGTPIPIEYWAYPIKRNGNVVGSVVTWMDISERRAAEAQLRKLSLAVEQSFESIVITDLNGNIEYVNQAFLNTTGYSAEDVIGQNPRVLQSGRTPKHTYETLWATISNGQPWKGTFYNVRRDGTEYVEFAVISPIRQDDGQITHYVAAKEDITEKQRADEELKQYRYHLEELVGERTKELAEARRRADAANQAKSAFLANMSHEIRTPMNGVIGVLDVLKHSGLSDKQNDLVDVIRQSAGTLLGVIDDVLDFSKIEAGKMELELAPVSVADIVESVCASLAVTASRREIELHVFVDPNVNYQVLADELRVRQVLYNLIGNALKFTGGQEGRQGRVWVTAEQLQNEPGRLLFRIDDNGIGMTNETTRQLFNAFTQAEVSTTRRFGGTGLGLTICQRLVDLMGGEIGVESHFGEGSSFNIEVTFDYLKDQPPTHDIDLKGTRCMLISNEQRDTDAIAAYLKHAGAHVSHFTVSKQLSSPTSVSTESDLIIYTDSALGEMSPAEALNLPKDMPVIFIEYINGNAHNTHQNPNLIKINGNGLRRRTLLQNVAIAAGRALPRTAELHSEDSAQNREAAAPSVAAAREQGRLILVAEDDAINQMVILEQLGLLGYAAEVTSNGVEALQKWRDGSYALLLTDLHMPEMDGYELTTTIRREESGKRRPILVLTANALRGEAQQAAAAGVDDYLTKPVQLERLKQALESWLPKDSPPASCSPLESAGVSRPQSTTEFDVIDLGVLKALIGDDEAVIQNMLTSYKDTAQEYAESLLASCSAGDLPEAGAIAHKLKSASRSIGAMALGDLCASIESAAKGGEDDATQVLIPQFETSLAQVDEVLGRLLYKGR